MAGKAVTIQDHFGAAVRALESGSKLALDKVAAVIERDAKSNAPIRTGALRASGFRITPVYNDWGPNTTQAMNLNENMVPDDMPDVSPDEAVVGFSAGYAGYVHDGTSRMAGNPFLMMAVEASAQAIVDLATQAVNVELQQALPESE